MGSACILIAGEGCETEMNEGRWQKLTLGRKGRGLEKVRSACCCTENNGHRWDRNC